PARKGRDVRSDRASGGGRTARTRRSERALSARTGVPKTRAHRGRTETVREFSSTEGQASGKHSVTGRITTLCVFCVLSRPASVAAQGPPGAAMPDRERTLKLAADALDAGRRDEAARLLRSAADRFQSVQALLQLARIQSGNGDGSDAFASLERARTIAPNSEEVLSAVAQVSLATRLPFPAITTLDSLTRLCPTVSQYHYLLGVALMQMGEMSLAVDSLKTANQLEPDHVLTLVALGLA